MMDQMAYVLYSGLVWRQKVEPRGGSTFLQNAGSSLMWRFQTSLSPHKRHVPSALQDKLKVQGPTSGGISGK